MTSPARQRRAPSELDELAVFRAKTGDAAAFRQLVAFYQRPVHALLWRMLAPSGLADRVDDLFQDTFVRVYRALASFDVAGPARLSTWILTIATRVALTELARPRRGSVPLEAIAETVAASGPQGDGRRALERKQLAAAIARAVASLAPPLRAVVVLREYHGLDYADIAAALDIDLGTVKSRLSRARRKLRQQLEEVDR